MASPAFPEPPPSMPATSFAEAEAHLQRLHARKDAWVALGVPERLALLRACAARLPAQAEAWVADAARAKGLHPGTPQVGEEWLGGPMTTQRNLRLLIEALEANGQPKPPATKALPSGQIVAKVFPGNLQDSLMFTGFSGEVWIEPGKPASQGRIYREKKAGQPGKVALVLGAGNVASIGPMDALYKLFVEDEVVLLKTNPVNAYLGPHIEAVFAPLIEAGFFAIVHGGAEIGGFLAHHKLVDTLHMTGSNYTHDAIVWGSTPEEQARRKAANDPICTKPITSELGAVTPVLIVPGDWSESDMDFQARHIAGMVANNGSFNCNAAKVILYPSGWKLKEAFREKVRAQLAKTTPKKAYYPGAQDRYRRFLEAYPKHKVLGEAGPEVVPWTILPEVPAKAGEYALTNEAFCGVLAEVEIEASDALSYLEKAVPFANDGVWGTLSCMMLVHPSTQKAHPEAVEKAIADLRYGGVGVNVWAGVIYGLVCTTWGAFPGHPLTDIRSGVGVVHNTYLFDHPQKSVVRAPFRISPTPAWFPDNKNLIGLGRALTQFETSGSWLDVLRVVFQALQG